jgi:hypothetical protein
MVDAHVQNAAAGKRYVTPQSALALGRPIWTLVSTSQLYLENTLQYVGVDAVKSFIVSLW